MHSVRLPLSPSYIDGQWSHTRSDPNRQSPNWQAHKNTATAATLIAQGFELDIFRIKCKKPHLKAPLLRCRRCMQPGHTDLTCNNKPVCGHCAGEHITNNCSSTQLPPKCALGCKEPHKGTDKDCPVWRTHVVRFAATQRQQYAQHKQANTQKRTNNTFLQCRSHHGQHRDRTRDHNWSHPTN